MSPRSATPTPVPGNFGPSTSDNLIVDCDTCREAISARSDGEAEPVPVEEVDAHLESCAACRQWQEDAAVLTRTLRVRHAVDVPDLTAAVLQAAPPVPPVVRATRGWYARMGLAGVSVAQLSLGLAQVFSTGDSATHGQDRVSTHLFNESTAWNIAIGLGMLWTALHPRAASGMLPVVAAFVAVLVPFSAFDLATGVAPLSRIATHGFLVLGLVLLAVVHRGRRAPEGGTPLATLPDGPEVDLDDDSGTSPEEHPNPRGGWGHLRPVSRKGAA